MKETKNTAQFATDVQRLGASVSFSAVGDAVAWRVRNLSERAAGKGAATNGVASCHALAIRAAKKSLETISRPFN